MEILISYTKVIVVIVVLSALVNLILGGLIFLDSPRRKVNRLFAALGLVLAAWNGSFAFLHLASSVKMALFWLAVYSSAFLLVAPLYYHLVLGNIGDAYKGRGARIPNFFNRLKLLGYFSWMGWLLVGVQNSLPREPMKVVGGVQPPLLIENFWLVCVIYSIFIGVGLLLLVRNFLKAQELNQKNRLLYLQLVGVGFLLVGIILSLSSLPWCRPFSVGIVGGGHVGATLFLILAAYALTSSQLYHFSELFRKTLAFVFLTLILLLVFGGTHIISRKFLNPYIPQSDFLALGFSSVIMALVFHPLRFRVQNVVDRFFFSQRYDQMQRLRGLSRRVLSSADRDELLNVLFSSLRGVGFGSVSLLLKDPQKPVFYVKKGLGLPPQSEGFFLRNDSLLIQYLREEKKELVRDEVTRRILTDWERQSLSDEMEVLQSDICFPLFSTRRRALFGVITLGNSELGYSSFLGRNIFWLKAVIDNSGIMLDNFYHHEFANALIPYVGRVWADEMRKNKEGFRERLIGHRTWVAIVMVDIRHFTTMSARMDPSNVVELLREFRSHVAPIVYRYQGTIDKFIGDAIMIVFGLPILPALDNPDLAAVECAHLIRSEVERMSVSRFDPNIGDRISIGIGVSSGEVIAGNVDSGDRIEYTVIGDAPNMVARLEDLAGDNQILLSPATYQRVQDRVEANEWAERHLTGFAKPLSIYELIKMKEEPQPSERPLRAETDPLAANQ